MEILYLFPPLRDRNRSLFLYGDRLKRTAPPDLRIEFYEIPPLLGHHIPSGFFFRFFGRKVLHERVHLLDGTHAYLLPKRIPFLYATLHDLIPSKALSGCYPSSVTPSFSLPFQIWYRYSLSRLRNCTCVITPTKAVWEDAKTYLSLSRVEVVPHGIDPIFLEEEDEESRGKVETLLNPLQGRPFLLFRSSGFFYKNDRMVSSLFLELSRREESLTFVVVGRKGKIWDAFSKKVSQERFLFLPFQPLPVLRGIYRRAFLLLHPSWDEGFGWIPLEVFASGGVALTSPMGGLKETAPPSSQVLYPDDLTGMEKVVREFLHNPGRREELREEGREWVSSFSWEKTWSQLLSIYEETQRGER